MKQTSYDVIVLGATIDGLAAASRLANKGKSVLLLDSGEVPGGLAQATSFKDTFGEGSPIAWHDVSGVSPKLLRELSLEKHGLQYWVGRPNTLLLNRHGDGIELGSDPEKVKQQLLKVSAQDADGYERFQKLIGSIQQLVEKLAFQKLPNFENLSITELSRLGTTGLGLRRLGKETMFELTRLAPMCVADLLDEFFTSDFIKGALCIPALQGNFAGPWSPGTATHLLFHECLANTTIQGGVQALVSALVKSGHEAGVETVYETLPTSIEIDGQRAVSVKLADGTTVAGGAILSSLDPRHTFRNLISPRHLSSRLRARMRHYRGNGITARLNLKLSKHLRFACAPDARVGFAYAGASLDHVERAFDAVKYNAYSSEPALDISIPTVDSPELHPQGGDIVSMWVHYAPYHLEGGWDESARQGFLENTLQVLDGYAPGVRDTIESHELLVPPDFETKFGAVQGHVLFGDMGLDQLISRPTPECAQYETPIEGLYLCGHGSHPGAFSPGASGLMAAQQVIR